MSQHLVGCCCQGESICSQRCDDPSVTPDTINLHLPGFDWVANDLCQHPCYPDQNNPIAFSWPGQSLTMYKCARVGQSGQFTNRSWSYRSTAIPIGSVQTAYGYGGGPCKTVPLYLVAKVFQTCGPYLDQTSNSIVEYTNQWEAFWAIAKGKGYGTGFCEGDRNCVITPIDMSLTPCRLGPNNSFSYGLVDWFTWTETSSCLHPDNTPVGSTDAVDFPLRLGGMRYAWDAPTNYQWSINAFQSRWAYDPSAPPQCDPRGEYVFPDLNGNVQAVQVT
jgi:hypothetical protein